MFAVVLLLTLLLFFFVIHSLDFLVSLIVLFLYIKIINIFQHCKQVTQNGRNDGIPSYRLNGSLTKISLEILVDYAYTAQLEIPDALVKDVYLAACQLKIDRVVNECARHLIEELSADSCIEIRSLPGISKNKTFVTAVDDFISKEVCICFIFFLSLQNYFCCSSQRDNMLN